MFRVHPLWVSPLVSLISISQGDSRSSHATQHKFDINNMPQNQLLLDSTYVLRVLYLKTCVSSWSASHRHQSLPLQYSPEKLAMAVCVVTPEL